ncbi:MAG: low molecular weight protein-tyrosine-phosphatase [Bacteroidota bacterium]
MKVLMVCLGNICRSPLAEGIMRSKVEAQELDWEVDSAGTGSWHVGNGPDPRSVAVARTHGLDISAQRARQFKAKDYKLFDLILTMDSSNYRNVLKLAPNDTAEQKVKMIRNFVRPGYNESVPDPYWDDDGFEQVYQMLDEACEKVLAHYR